MIEDPKTPQDTSDDQYEGSNDSGDGTHPADSD